MKRTLTATLLVLAMALPAAAAVAAERCREATEFTPRLCPADLPAIRSLHVERDRVVSPIAPDANVDCRRFRLTPRAARRYLSHAWRVDDVHVEHAVERGPCQAEGSLRMADGRRGRWRIEQIGTATLWLANDPPLTLLCPDCTFEPFRERP